MSTQAPTRTRNKPVTRSLGDTYASKQEASPYRFVAKDFAKEVGEAVRFRILSHHPEDTRKVNCRTAVRTFQNKEFKDPVHESIVFNDPEELIAENDLAGLVDAQGEDIADSKYQSLFRIPVWVYEKIGKPGTRGKAGTPTEIGKLMYWEISYPMFKNLLELEDHKQLDLRFDEEFLKPMYDLLITRNSDKGEKTWELIGLAKDPNNPKEDHPNYNVDDADAVGAEADKIVDEEWETLQAEMDKIQTLDQIRYILGRKEKTERALGRKPSMPGGDESEADTNREVGNAPEAEVPPTPGVDASEEDTNREEVKGFRRRSSRVAA